MVFMPPQHGKSELVSRRLPAYLLGKDPTKLIAGCSYSSDLATSFNRDVQRIIDDEVYYGVFPGTTLNSSNVKTSAKGSYLRNADLFEIVEHRGKYKSVGVGGALTGFTVDIGIIDDPIKDRMQAESLTVRENVWGWYNTVFSTRLHNDSQQLITLTRWHDDDLAGRILKKANKDGSWHILTLEAIRERIQHPKDPRQQGEALWESRHSKKKIMGLAQADPQTFQALYQQDPRPFRDNLFVSNFQYTKHVKNVEYSVDAPIHFSVDFNARPHMSGLLMQVDWVDDGEWNGHESYWELRVFKEYALKPPKNHSKGLGEELLAEFGNNLYNGLYLYGDASGRNQTGIKGAGVKTKTHFTEVVQGLGAIGKVAEMRVPNTNPKYRGIGKGMMGRRIFLNEVMSGRLPIRVMIAPDCIELIEDLKTCTQDANGKLAKNKNKEGVEERGHHLDAFQYFLCHPKTFGKYAKIR